MAGLELTSMAPVIEEPWMAGMVGDKGARSIPRIGRTLREETDNSSLLQISYEAGSRLGQGRGCPYQTPVMSRSPLPTYFWHRLGPL